MIADAGRGVDRRPARGDRGDPALLLPRRREPGRGRANRVRVAVLDDDGRGADRAARSPSRSRSCSSTRPEPGLMRLAILGLWQLTLWEYALTLLRLDERARAYFTFTIAAVLVTIPITVALVVGTDLGASAILLGNFGTGVAFLLGRLWVERRRLGFTVDGGLLRRMIRFGLPTMPAELTLYSLNFDRPSDHHRSGSPGARRGGRPLRDRGQVRERDAGPGPRLPPGLAAARVLDPGRRRGAARLRPDRHLVRRALLVRGRRALAPRAVARPGARRRALLRRARGGRPARRGHRALRALPGAGRDPRPHRPHRVLVPGDGGGGGGERRPQPAAGPGPRDHRRRRRAARLVRGRRRADARDHAPALLRAVRVGPAGARGRPRRGR